MCFSVNLRNLLSYEMIQHLQYFRVSGYSYSLSISELASPLQKSVVTALTWHCSNLFTFPQYKTTRIRVENLPRWESAIPLGVTQINPTHYHGNPLGRNCSNRRFAWCACQKTGGWCQTHPFPTSRWFMCHATIIITLLSLPVNNMFHNILFTNLRTPTETRTPFIGLKNQDPNP